MAGDWIRLEKTTPDKPEVWEIASKLGIDDADLIVGKLVRFWVWVDSTTNDGQLKTSYAFIDRLVHCTGFAKTLAMIGWLAGRDGLLFIPNYDRHHSQSAKARALEAEAKRLRRNVGQMSDKCPTKKPQNVRPEKRREDIEYISNNAPNLSEHKPSQPCSLDEVEHHMKNQPSGRRDPEFYKSTARDFVDYYTGTGWVMPNGSIIRDWKPFASRWVRRALEQWAKKQISEQAKQSYSKNKQQSAKGPLMGSEGMNLEII